MLFPLVNHSPIGPSKTDVRLSVEESLDPIERRLESLGRASLALWSLLKEKTGATEEELTAEIQKRKSAEEQHSDALSIVRTVEDTFWCVMHRSVRRAGLRLPKVR